MLSRSLILPEPGTESFFLWGPRQTGKTTLLRESYGDGRWGLALWHRLAELWHDLESEAQRIVAHAHIETQYAQIR